MEITIAHIADTWRVSLYAPAERRWLEGPLELHSALTAYEFARRWQARGASISAGSLVQFEELLEECAALSRLVVLEPQERAR